MPPARLRHPLRRRAADLLRWLPRGHTLPEDTWQRRHAVMQAVLLLHLPALAAFGALRGRSGAELAAHLVPIALLAAAAALPTVSRRWRAALVSFGVLSCSAVLVSLTDGT